MIRALEVAVNDAENLASAESRAREVGEIFYGKGVPLDVLMVAASEGLRTVGIGTYGDPIKQVPSGLFDVTFSVTVDHD